MQTNFLVIKILTKDFCEGYLDADDFGWTSGSQRQAFMRNGQ